MALVFWTSVLGVIALVYYLLRRNSQKQLQFWPSRNFPAFDAAEVLGHPFAFNNLVNPKAIRVVDEMLYEKVKHQMQTPYAGVMLFGQKQLIVTDLDFAKKVFVKDSEYFLARLQFPEMKETDPLFYRMLFFMEGDPWKELRAKMSPTFTTGKIKKLFYVFDTSSKKLVDYLTTETTKRPSDEVELCDVYGRYTMDVIASGAFGIDAKTFAEADPIFTRMGKKLQFEANFKMIVKFLFLTFFPKIGIWLGIALLDQGMQKFFSNVVLNAIRHRETTGDRRDDFLQLMLDARSGQLKDDDESEKSPDSESVKSSASSKVDMSDDVLVAQSVLFILAGFDTTQTLLVFAIYELALNPDVQEKLREELDRSAERNGGKFTYETVNQLEYLDKVVNESLRKYPPVTRLERRATHDYQVPDTKLVIPKGAQVVIPTYCIHRDEEYFPNPDRFDPERFSQENKSSRNPYAFQPFGHGPRNCIGMRFALTNAKMAIATLVHNFKFEPSEKTLIPMDFEKTNFLKPKGGMFLKVTRLGSSGEEKDLIDL